MRTGRIFYWRVGQFSSFYFWMFFFIVFTSPPIAGIEFSRFFLKTHSYTSPTHPALDNSNKKNLAKNETIQTFFKNYLCCVISAQPLSSIKHNRPTLIWKKKIDRCGLFITSFSRFFNLCAFDFFGSRLLFAFFSLWVYHFFPSSFSLLLMLCIYFSPPFSRGCFVQIFFFFPISNSIGIWVMVGGESIGSHTHIHTHTRG